MSRYVLDTDHVTLHQRGHPEVVARIQASLPADLAITVVTVEEQMRGRLAQIGRPGVDVAVAYAQLRATTAYFCDLPVLLYNTEADRIFQQMRSQKIRTGTLDLRIAAIALRENAILVTRNRRDFEQVAGLQVEDWSQ